MSPQTVTLLGQENRPPCSLPMADADLSLGNANWTKGLQAMSDWIWSAQLNPVRFPNNLGRFFLHIPGVFEQQLAFSTTLIFDEPSFRNGVQVSGMIDRVTRELVINLIAQRRRCWYSMTHHAVLGFMTARKHGLADRRFTEKWLALTDKSRWETVFTPLEIRILEFADAFAADPKAYTDAQYQALREAFLETNRRRYGADGLWMARLAAARAARARGLLTTDDEEELAKSSAAAAQGVPGEISAEANEFMVNAQIVELAALCLQFVALTGVLTALHIPDEDFLPGVIAANLPAEAIARLNELLGDPTEGLPSFVPPAVSLPIDEILAGQVVVEPAPLRGRRLPLRSYEVDPSQALRDKGLAVGGIQVGVWGWSFGAYFPGSLPYALMHHPELARFEAPYSLPLLFNEDEWRNGTQTGGFISRRLKELLIQRVYRLVRARYGIEHHTMFYYNTVLDEHGVGRSPAGLDARQQEDARAKALRRASDAVLHMADPEKAPAGVYTELETAAMAYTAAIVGQPHKAYQAEANLRALLDRQNRREIGAGLRVLDGQPGLGEQASLRRLLDHQIAELAMVVGHMDGLGRFLTILQLESEEGVQAIRTRPGSPNVPELTADGQVQWTGYMTNRPGLFEVLRMMQMDERVLTVNELTVNPKLCQALGKALKSGEKKIHITADTAMETGEF